MSYKLFFIAFITIIVFFSFHPQKIFAKEQLPLTPIVTVVNPLRGHQLGLEHADLAESLKGQWNITKKAAINATWLWQYSTLDESKMVSLAKSEMKGQEFGIFLEVDKNFADRTGVQYKGKGPWYHSDGLLLVSYDQFERRRLIDEVFKKFHNTFGYYPKSVGAWWVGADAIAYMRKKYGIVAVLQCTDQFNTDAYSLWGTPWSIPYIPSKKNAAIPAQNSNDLVDNVVIVQWATRDPFRAYGNSVADSVYSVQDMKVPELSYYNYLSSIYLKKPYDQTVIGLEGGLPSESYTIWYEKQLHALKVWEKEKKITLQTLEEYANVFLQQNKILPPTNYMLTKDYQTEDQSFWYHSPFYRIGIQKVKNKIFLVDFRDYRRASSEEFSILPNTQSVLRVNTTAIVDSVRFPGKRIMLASSKMPLEITKDKDTVVVKTDKRMLATFTKTVATFFTISPSTFTSSTHSIQRTNNVIYIDFFKEQISIAPFIFIVITLIFYLLFLMFFIKNKAQFFLAGISLLLHLLVMFPLLTNGALFSDSYFFEKKYLFLLTVTSSLSILPAWKIVIIYQLIPIVSILFLNVFLIKTVRKSVFFIIVYLAIYIITLFLSTDVAKVFIEVTNQGKKVLLGVLGLLILFVSLFCLGFYWYKQLRIKLVTVSLGIIFLILFFLSFPTLFSQKKFIITPFEMEALTYLYEQKKEVIFVTTKHNTSIELYKAISPILFMNASVEEWLTNTHWQEMKRIEGKPLRIKNYKNKIVVVPSYQGAFLYEDEKIQYKLVKKFDNAQIEIYIPR